jgi:hypothetical protein
MHKEDDPRKGLGIVRNAFRLLSCHYSRLLFETKNSLTSPGSLAVHLGTPSSLLLS